MECITRANDIRSTHATHVNNVSSRSHVFYRISIGSSKRGGGGELTLLDLAGSERNEDTFYHTPERIRESIEINSSHMALKQCVHAMVDSSEVAKDIKHIPYRSSMLTRILKDCLWAESSKAAVIVTLSPISSDTEHTLHALKIGQIMGGWDESSMVTQTKMEVDEYISNIENINTTNIPTNYIKTWSNQDVCKWLSQVQEGRFQKYLINVSSSVDGRQLLRFGLPRFNQICNGDLVDAEIIYNELKSLQKKERVKKK